MIRVVGETTDGKPVVDGVYRFYETHGVPLDVVLEGLKLRGMVPCWVSLYREARAAGMKHDRIVSKVEAAIADSYGSEVKIAVVSGLNILNEKGLL